MLNALSVIPRMLFVYSERFSLVIPSIARNLWYCCLLWQKWILHYATLRLE